MHIDLPSSLEIDAAMQQSIARRMVVWMLTAAVGEVIYTKRPA